MANDRDATIEQLEAELRQANVENTALREERTATADVLRAIASPAHDLHGVLATLGHRAIRVCDAQRGAVYQVQGNVMRRVSDTRFDPDSPEWTNRPLDRGRAGDSRPPRSSRPEHAKPGRGR
jgi:hypothetical protein